MSPPGASAARAEVLQRIRTALGRAGEPPDGGDGGSAGSSDGLVAGSGVPGTTAGSGLPRTYRMHGNLEAGPLLDLLAERLADYRAAVRRCEPAALGATVAAALAERGARRVIIAPGADGILPAADLPPGIEVIADQELSAQDLDAADGVITTAALAIAETGTVVLDGSSGQGRRALTLVPDYHLCIVAAGDVAELVPEAVTRLAPAARRPLTWISGPSATSDIELSRVEGVHGPRALEVILVG